MKKNTIKFIYIGIALLFFVVFMLSLVFREQLTEIINGSLKIYGLTILFLASGILEGFPQYLAPQLLAFNAALLGFGFFETVLVLYIGSIAGSVIGFEIGYRFRESVSRAFLQEKNAKKLKKWFHRWGGWVVFVTAISPLPYIPLFFGVLHVKRKHFWLLGVLPRIIYYFYMALIAYAVF